MAQVKQSPPTTQFKLFLTFWAFMENLLFSGLRAGWPALVYILKQERVYSHLCTEHDVHMYNITQLGSVTNRQPEYALNMTNQEPSGNMTTCDAQDAIFNQCFTVATATMALSAMMYGQLNYKYGLRVPRVLSVFLFVAGAVSIAFVNEDNPWLVFPGFLLISSGGMALYLTNNQISYMFTRGSASLVGLLCGALEASSFVQTVIKLAYEHDVSLRVSYLVLAGLYCVTLVSTFFLLPKYFVTESSETLSSRDPSGKANSNVVSGTDQIVLQEPVTSKISSSGNRESVTNDASRQTPGKSEVNDEMIEQSLSRAVQMYEGIKTTPTDNKNTDLRQPIEQKSESDGLDPYSDQKVGGKLLQCLFSKTFLLYLLWACVVQIVLAMCLGTFNPWLEFVTEKDNQEVSRFTDVLLYSMLGSPVLSLCIGLGMDIMNKGDNQYKRAEVIRTLKTSIVSLGATSVMAVIQCVLVITCHPDVIVIASVMLVIFRTALYSCGTAFLRIMYPSEYFGILCGIMSLLAGGFSFLQYPLFLWIQLREQAWKEVFGFLGLLGIVSLVQPFYLFWRSKTISLTEKSTS